MLLLLMACTHSDTGDSKETGGPTDTADTQDTGDTQETGDTSETGDTEDTGDTGDACGGDPECELPVSDPTADCGSTSSSDPPEILATWSGPGEVEVLVVNGDWGCCPEGVTVTAMMTPADARIVATWVLGMDPCDCICALDIGFTLSDVPVGTWELDAAGTSTTVVVGS